MKTLVVELHFFPNIEYFKKLYAADVVLFEGCESFQKQSYRSRCKILGANGELNLSIPVNHGANRGLIQSTTIEYTQNWVVPFWRTLEASYRKSPYFVYFEDIFKPILFSETQSLFDLNLKIIKECCRFLNIEKEIQVTSDYVEVYEEEGIIDWRNKIHPKKECLENSFQEYPQNFGTTFVENLSIIDLIMNEGPAAVMYLMH